MRTVLHSDLNNFYASVECSLHPELRGRPVAVCGNPEMRHGIILAKNYEAKAFGVRTGEALWEAKEKCPDIIFVPPHFDVYMQYSKESRAIYAEYTDQVEAFGLDECWLDVTGSRRIFGDGKTIRKCSVKIENGKVTTSLQIKNSPLLPRHALNASSCPPMCPCSFC